MAFWDLFSAFRRPAVYYVNVGPDAPTQVLNLTARELYQTQPNLQAVINYRAESIGQLPLKVYLREGENNRTRDRDSAAAKLLWRPNKVQTAFEFWRAVSIEYDVFGNVYVWVIPSTESESGYEMYIIPSTWVVNCTGNTVYQADSIRICPQSGTSAVEIHRSEFVQFRTYSPGNPGGYLSPLTALRNTLQEQIEAGKFRQELWHSSGRLNAQIIRPKDVQPWDENTRKAWITAFREAWGAGGAKAGSIPLMEDGMEIKPFSTSFKEQQWAESVQLSREDVAAAYRINPALIWHTGTQTYASAKDNARALYAECLGPTIQMLQQRINAFLLPMIGADPRLYVEFDFNEKLKGSFEERASILQSAVGGPWMTRDEARAENNLPPLPDGQGKELIVPLNVVEGGQASPTDTHMGKSDCGCVHRKSGEIRIKARAAKEESDALTDVLADFFSRQKRSVMPKINSDAEEWWNADRWDRELSDDMFPLISEISAVHGKAAAAVIGTEYSTERTEAYLRALSDGRAKAINTATRRKLEEVMIALDTEEENEDPDLEGMEQPEDVFDKRISSSAVMLGTTMATQIAGWSTLEAGRQARDQGERRTIEKEWVTGPNARPTHQIMNGQRVGIDQPFSNGAMWPGDDNLSEDESCGCNCTTDVIIS